MRTLSTILLIVMPVMLAAAVPSVVMAVRTGGWRVLLNTANSPSWLWPPVWFRPPRNLDPDVWRHMRRGVVCFIVGWVCWGLGLLLRSASEAS